MTDNRDDTITEERPQSAPMFTGGGLLHNAVISDLFFNHDHTAAWHPGGKDEGGYYDPAGIEEQANEFVEMLDRIGAGPLPTGEALAADFFARM